MAACPNYSSPQWLALKEKIGEFEAMREFILNGEEIPNPDNYTKTYTVSGNPVSKDGTVPQEAPAETKELVEKLDKTAQEVVNKPVGEDDNAYFIGTIPVFNRVTTFVKSVFKNRFKDNEFTALEKRVNDQKKEWGSRGHRDMQKVIQRFLTPEGKTVVVNGQLVPQNTNPIKSEIDPTNRGLFGVIVEYAQELLLSYPEGTVFKLEQTIYSDRGGKPGERDIAGTMDFMAIKPDGKRDILDWKFFGLHKDQEDIQWYKVDEWNLQMQEYKKILKRDYGLTDSDFGKTRMIPFAITYTPIQGKNATVLPEDLEVASLDLKIEGKAYLLPVVTPDESTGDIKLDNLIHRLTGLYKTLKTIPPSEKQKNLKNEQLNELFRAIRHLQVAKSLGPLTEQIGILIKDSERVIKEHKEKFEKLTDLTEAQISEQAANLLLKAQALHIYQNLNTEFQNFYGDNPRPEEILIMNKLAEVTGKAQTAYKNINDIVEQFATKYVAERRGVEDLLKKEKAVTGATRYFGTTSELPTAALETLFLMVDNANNKIQFDLADVKDELVEMKKEVEKWGGLKKALPLLVKKPEPQRKDEKDADYKKRLARESNKLVDEYDGEFYDQLKEAIEDADLNWIKANIDMAAFKEESKKIYKEQKQLIEETRYSYDDLENQNKKREALEKLALTTNPDKNEAYFEKNQYYILKKFPLDKWHSQEYKILKENAPVFKFYEFIKKWNVKAKEIGYLERAQADRNFLPYLYKSFSERLNMEGVLSSFTGMGDAIMAGLTIDENVAGYGNFNELTGQMEDSIPTYFTKRIDNPDQISEDLFLNVAAYVKAVINFDQKTQIDGQVKALYFIEQNKGSLSVDSKGDLIRINGVAQPIQTNDANSNLLLNHMKSLQYGQKYTNVDSTDALLGDWAKKTNKLFDKIEKATGIKFPHLSEGKQVSLTRLMDTFNRAFTIKNMGLNIATSASVLAGGNFQAIINSGKYATAADFLAAEFQHASHQAFNNNKELHMALIRTFMPVDEELGREINKLASGAVTGNSFADLMMFMMRKADHTVQYANFLAFMKNTIVVDGKLYNAREYYRNSKAYANRYNLNETERKKLESEFDSKVTELIQKHGVTENSSADEQGKLSIKGISNIKNDNIFQYRTLINSIGKRATGNVSPENEMLIRMNAILRSMMVFKNWIPGLVKQRIGGLRYDAASQSYEYGRLRMLIKHLGPLALFKIGDINNILKGNDKGVALMKEYFKNQKESFTNKTDKELEMSEAEFIDMFRQNLGNQMKELAILLSMIAIVTALLPLFKPDDDDEAEIKNKFKFASRLLDKVKDEVWFYYNPVGLQQILNGSIFPALGLLTDAYKVVSSTMTEIYGITVGDTELIEKNFALKNWMRALPVAREMTYYIAMFNADLAKELGIQISSQSRMK